MTKETNAKKWFKYLSRAMKTKNPNMRLFFHKKAIEYALKVDPDLVLHKKFKQSYAPPTDKYGAIRDNMMDE